MFVKVIYSDDTNALIKEFLRRKALRIKINTENRFLRNLMFFGGAIQGEAQKKRNQNKEKLKVENLEITRCKKEFDKHYQLDYERACEKTRVSSMVKSRIEEIDTSSEEVKKLKYMLEMTDGYIDFGEALNIEIQKRINE